MLNIKFITDSTSDIPKEYAEENNIGVVGVRINFPEGNSVADWYEITHDEFYDYLERTNNIPSTSQPPIAEIADMFEKALQDHEAIIFVATSSNSSGSFNSARLAKEMVLEKNPNAKIEIVDSQAFSLFETIMLEEGLKLQKEGKSIEEIVEGMKMRRRLTDVCVVVDTLKYLEKGGRINKASLIAGTLLDLKPVLSVRGGTMESIDKFRGSKTVIQKMVKKVKTMDIDLSDPQFSFVHSHVEPKALEMIAAFEEGFENSKARFFNELGATVATHIGPGTLAVFFKLNTPQKIYEED